MNKKAIALFSGGLDSILAAKIIIDQGIEVIGVNFIMEFASKDLDNHKKQIIETARQINITPEIIDISEEFLEVLKNPSYGFGANINPCIDCKILMLSKARELAKERAASFVITGEVLGERPMSQRKDALNAIKRKSGLDGYLLRPLSAKLLEETIPEKEGIVDRNKLLEINGRSRKPQLELAQKLGINKYFTPAGGCLLTDPGYSRRLKDLMAHGKLSFDDIKLLKFGRHFRFGDSAKFILGKDEKDNKWLATHKAKDDIMFKADGFPGPIGILRGGHDEKAIKKAASFLIGHTKKKEEMEAVVKYWGSRDETKRMFTRGAAREDIESARI